MKRCWCWAATRPSSAVSTFEKLPQGGLSMALLIGCLALFLAAGYWLMDRVDAFLARSVVCEAGTKPRNDGIMARREVRAHDGSRSDRRGEARQAQAVCELRARRGQNLRHAEAGPAAERAGYGRGRRRGRPARARLHGAPAGRAGASGRTRAGKGRRNRPGCGAGARANAGIGRRSGASKQGGQPPQPPQPGCSGAA